MPSLVLPTLQGPRVTLRVLETSDADAFTHAVSRSAELHGPWVQPAADRSSFETYLARKGAAFVPYGVFSREDGGLAGVFNVSQIVLGFFCSAYLGYFALHPYERRGLMCEGLELTLHAVFEHIGLHRLEANIQPKNVSSIALVRRCGFEHEGFSPGYLYIAGAWRDHERWAIRREIWRPRRDIRVLG